MGSRLKNAANIYPFMAQAIGHNKPLRGYCLRNMLSLKDCQSD